MQAIPADARIAAALTIYKGLGRDRTLAELSARTGVHVSVLGRWKSQYHWDIAASQYDAEIARAALERDSAALVETWRKRKDDQLKTALLLRKKAWDYLVTREMEGTEDRKGRTLVGGIDVLKGHLALSFIKEANAIERAILGGAETLTINVQGGLGGLESLTPELLAAQIQAAVSQRDQWREENDLPPLEGPDANPLGAYLV